MLKEYPPTLFCIVILLHAHAKQAGQKLYIVVEDFLICKHLVLLFYSVISHVSTCALLFCPLLFN